VGNGGTCAVKRDGTVWCWGTNDVGELGQGSNDTSPHPTPVQVTLPPARQVAYGAFHVCAVLVDNTVQCWGNNKFGQAGLAPSASDAQCDPGDGLTAGCQRRPRAVEGLAGVRQVTAGRNHTCALLDDGTVRCWGLNQLGQVGNGLIEAESSPRVTPTRVTGLTDVTQVSAGGSHTCAVRSDGTVHCWGWNNLGQLGAASRESCQGPTGSPFTCARTATAVPELTGVRQLSAGRYHTCATLTAGGVRCAGRNDEFQLGLGVVGRETCSGGADSWACTRTFSEVAIPSTREVTVGNYHACAALTDGTVRCWGAGYYGQIGDGATTNREAPVAASNLP
jgi:alpha-tubulin suppressor-like RCC1 family protein